MGSSSSSDHESRSISSERAVEMLDLDRLVVLVDGHDLESVARCDVAKPAVDFRQDETGFGRTVVVEVLLAMVAAVVLLIAGTGIL